VIIKTIDKINDTTIFPRSGIFFKKGVYKIIKGIIIIKINDFVKILKFIVMIHAINNNKREYKNAALILITLEAIGLFKLFA
jgi:hypothetical protein